LLMTSSNFTVADLRGLAVDRGYRLVSRGDSFWIIEIRSGVPELNEKGDQMTFSFAETRAMLLSLTP
jgi:hypothetical protein